MTGRIERGNHALTVWNDNPGRRNALTPDYYAALHHALGEAAADGAVGAVVLAGAGGYFCAGGDLEVLAGRQELPKRERAERIEALHEVIRAIRDCPAPVIAAVEGGAAGAGFALAMACDIVIAASGARFAASYVRAGLTPDGGLTHALGSVLPQQTVLPILLTGAAVPAERLAALGALSELVPPGGAVDRAQALACDLAHGPREAQVRIKRLARSAPAATFDAQLAAERDSMARAQGGPEAAEGISAFLEKREPDFGRLRK